MIKPKDKFKVIKSLSTQYPILLLCNIAGVSKSGYYKWLYSSTITTADKDADLKSKILDIYNKSKKTFGYRRIKVALNRQEDLIVNNKKVMRLMYDLGIKSVIRRRKSVYTSSKAFDLQLVKENILKRNFAANGPDEKWSTDITYLYYGENKQHKAYLSAIKDLYTNEIISYKLSKSFDLSFVIKTVKDALSYKDKEDWNGLIIHSDQGGHYKAREYQKLLEDYNIIQSMSRKGNCFDNACIENFFGYLKSEMIYQNSFTTYNELSNAIDTYIDWYNNERFQSKLNNHTPIEFRCAV